MGRFARQVADRTEKVACGRLGDREDPCVVERIEPVVKGDEPHGIGKWSGGKETPDQCIWVVANSVAAEALDRVSIGDREELLPVRRSIRPDGHARTGQFDWRRLPRQHGSLIKYITR